MPTARGFQAWVVSGGENLGIEEYHAIMDRDDNVKCVIRSDPKTVYTVNIRRVPPEYQNSRHMARDVPVLVDLHVNSIAISRKLIESNDEGIVKFKFRSRDVVRGERLRLTFEPPLLIYLLPFIEREADRGRNLALDDLGHITLTVKSAFAAQQRLNEPSNLTGGITEDPAVGKVPFGPGAERGVEVVKFGFWYGTQAQLEALSLVAIENTSEPLFLQDDAEEIEGDISFEKEVSPKIVKDEIGDYEEIDELPKTLGEALNRFGDIISAHQIAHDDTDPGVQSSTELDTAQLPGATMRPVSGSHVSQGNDHHRVPKAVMRRRRAIREVFEGKKAYARLQKVPNPLVRLCRGQEKARRRGQTVGQLERRMERESIARIEPWRRSVDSAPPSVPNSDHFGGGRTPQNLEKEKDRRASSAPQERLMTAQKSPAKRSTTQGQNNLTRRFKRCRRSSEESSRAIPLENPPSTTIQALAQEASMSLTSNMLPNINYPFGAQSTVLPDPINPNIQLLWQLASQVDPKYLERLCQFASTAAQATHPGGIGSESPEVPLASIDEDPFIIPHNPETMTFGMEMGVPGGRGMELEMEEDLGGGYELLGGLVEFLQQEQQRATGRQEVSVGTGGEELVVDDGVFPLVIEHQEKCRVEEDGI